MLKIHKNVHSTYRTIFNHVGLRHHLLKVNKDKIIKREKSCVFVCKTNFLTGTVLVYAVMHTAEFLQNSNFSSRWTQ